MRSTRMLCVAYFAYGFDFASLSKMATFQGGSRARLKPPGVHVPAFKSFIIQFVKSLGKDDRAAFTYYCINIIPQGKLDINVNDDQEFYMLIMFLQNDNKLSFTDLSLLKAFLTDIKRLDLLEALKKVELRIAISIILKNYTSNKFHQGSDIANNLYEDIVELLDSTREKSQHLICQALEQLRQVGDDNAILSLLDSVIQECQQNPQLSWPEVTALFVIMGGLCTSVSADSEVDEDFERTIELLAEWMLKLGGLKGFENWIKKKPKFASNDSALSSVGDSLKEYMKLIGHQVDMESLA